MATSSAATISEDYAHIQVETGRAITVTADYAGTGTPGLTSGATSDRATVTTVENVTGMIPLIVPVALSEIEDVTVYDQFGQVITDTVIVTKGTSQVKIDSNLDLTNIQITIEGTP